MTIVVALLALWIACAAAEAASGNRSLDRTMIDHLVAAVTRIANGQILLTVVLIGLVSISACYGETGGVQMLSLAVPHTAIWFAEFEVSAYLSGLAALATALAVLQRLMIGHSRRSLGGPPVAASAPCGARPRCSRRRALLAAEKDDEDGAASDLTL